MPEPTTTSRSHLNVGGIPLSVLVALLGLVVSIGAGYGAGQRAVGEQRQKVEQVLSENADIKRQNTELRGEIQHLRDNSISKSEYQQLVRQLDSIEKQTSEIRSWIINYRR